jgi:hypothetical protein
MKTIVISSFVNHPIMKQVANEPGEVVTDVYGTVVNFHRKELNPHGNDPVEKLSLRYASTFKQIWKLMM